MAFNVWIALILVCVGSLSFVSLMGACIYIVKKSDKTPTLADLAEVVKAWRRESSISSLFTALIEYISNHKSQGGRTDQPPPS